MPHSEDAPVAPSDPTPLSLVQRVERLETLMALTTQDIDNVCTALTILIESSAAQKKAPSPIITLP